MSATVIDSFALIAFFRGDPFGVPVKELLHKVSRSDRCVLMTELDYTEVKTEIMAKEGTAGWEKINKVLVALPIEFLPITRELANVAADIRLRFGLSIVNAFTIAFAKIKNADLITGNPDFKKVDCGIKILMLV